MKNSKLRIIVSGLIVQYPLGGVTWDYLQYVIGLARLGHDVYYFEDTGQCPYNPFEGVVSDDCSYNVNYLFRIMSRFGMENKWAYHFLDKSHGKSDWFGLSSTSRNEVRKTADLVIDISCTLRLLDDYKQGQRLVYVDTDPVFTQVKLKPISVTELMHTMFTSVMENAFQRQVRKPDITGCP
jgi:hypothetical protein